MNPLIEIYKILWFVRLKIFKFSFCLENIEILQFFWNYMKIKTFLKYDITSFCKTPSDFLNVYNLRVWVFHKIFEATCIEWYEKYISQKRCDS